MSDPLRGRRRAAAGVMGLALLLAPLVLLRNPTVPARGQVLATAGPSDTDLVARGFAFRGSRSAPVAATVPTTLPPTTVTAPPPPAPPVTHARPAVVVVATTTTTARPRPTTTVPPPPPPPPPTTTTTAGPARSQTGEASWYRGPDGECAHNTAPIGSTIRVTNLGNGKSTTCRVAGRGPYGAGRVVDLTESTFARVASLDAGVFHARVDW